MCFPRQNGFPADVVGFTPVDGRICARSDAIGQRSAPLRPAIRRLGARADARLISQRRKGGQRNEEEDQARRTDHADAQFTFGDLPNAMLNFRSIQSEPWVLFVLLVFVLVLGEFRISILQSAISTFYFPTFCFPGRQAEKCVKMWLYSPTQEAKIGPC